MKYLSIISTALFLSSCNCDKCEITKQIHTRDWNGGFIVEGDQTTTETVKNCRGEYETGEQVYVFKEGASEKTITESTVCN